MWPKHIKHKTLFLLLLRCFSEVMPNLEEISSPADLDSLSMKQSILFIEIAFFRIIKDIYELNVALY